MGDTTAGTLTVRVAVPVVDEKDAGAAIWGDVLSHIGSPPYVAAMNSSGEGGVGDRKKLTGAFGGSPSAIQVASLGPNDGDGSTRVVGRAGRMSCTAAKVPKSLVMTSNRLVDGGW